MSEADNVTVFPKTSAAYAAELSISLSLESQAVIKITNKTDKLIEFKHVYPGIVNAGLNSFDINEAFASGSIKLAVGATFSFRASKINNTQAETDFPRHLYYWCTSTA